MQIECIAPSNFGRGHKLIVSVSGQYSQPHMFDYDAPLISLVTPKVIDAIAGTTVVINGKNFGIQAGEGQVQPITVSVRSALCTELLFVRDSEVSTAAHCWCVICVHSSYRARILCV